MKHNNITYKFTYNLSTSFLIIIFIEQHEQQQELELKLNLPNRLEINEIIHRLANLNNLIFDYYIMLNDVNLNEFKTSLTEFLLKQNQIYYDSLAANQLINSPIDKLKLKNYWLKVLISNNQKSIVAPGHHDLIQAKEYYNLMHSNLMSVILEREKEYALQLNRLLTNTQTTTWQRLDQLKREQKHKFQYFIKKLLNNNDLLSNSSFSLEIDQDNDESLDDFDYIRIDTNPSIINSLKSANIKQLSSLQTLTRLEESYTIQLGAQLKTTHNLRLIRCNIYDFCSQRFNLQLNEIEPHAIQTALSLYSNKLCALVLLTNSTVENWSDLTSICDLNGCEFHFGSIDEQKQLALKHSNNKELNIGNFFITKHSNLSQVHVLFHLIAFENDSQSNLKQSDLSSRHPVILGLRNILKACVSNDIHTLTFPLLLTHEMTEEMTISWVMKRAELVLKCIKGFMIEFVNWGAQESRTLQFVVPQVLFFFLFNFKLIINLVATQCVLTQESRTQKISHNT